ncbi:unnamed protein product [Sphenostylis stenocarpa]|uniref:Uncharacterized protein n=1 Tax=Sphenostylis stenocarpa TaxID=92480 RepID=A0AA86SLZ6_9FABA|nr:unnamed protein product [Sphenostylis stenocarpa]
MVEEFMQVPTAQACSTESNIALIILDFDANSAKHGFAVEPESTEPRPNEPTPVERQGLNRGSYDNTIVNGTKDHEKHVPSSEALTWVQSQSTLLCHIKRPRHGPVVSSLSPSFQHLFCEVNTAHDKSGKPCDGGKQ